MIVQRPQRRSKNSPKPPMLIEQLALKNVGASMTTVLTKSFPQETPPARKAVPGKKRVLIVGAACRYLRPARALKRPMSNHANRPAQSPYSFSRSSPFLSCCLSLSLCIQVATAVFCHPPSDRRPADRSSRRTERTSGFYCWLRLRAINLGTRHRFEVACPGFGSLRKLELRLPW